MTFTDDIANANSQFRKIGAEVQMQNADGESKTFYVTKIVGAKLTVDDNHLLEGKILTVKVMIMDSRDVSQGQEQMTGINVSKGVDATTLN